MKHRKFTYSTTWKQWKTVITMWTCLYCAQNNGKIFHIENVRDKIPMHPNCKCYLNDLLAIKAGEATDDGTDGADWFLSYLGRLPENYITRKEATELGWRNYLGNLNEVAPGSVIFGGVFQNRKGILPQASGRIWLEADINFNGGFRNDERILFSNDGLIFVTYDHYETFVEVIR